MSHTHVPHTAPSSFDALFFESSETFVHPTAIIGPRVVLDHGAKVGPYAVLTGTVMVGARTQIHAHTMIGSSAQDVSVRTPLGTVEIGHDTVIKEFTTISAPKSADGVTRIGNHNFLMHFSHVAHDCLLEDHVTLTNNVLLAGHVYAEHHTLFMAHAAVHQRCRIGAYTALAPYTGARQDIPPFGLFTHQPAHFSGLNRIGLKRNGFSTETLNALKQMYHAFYQKKMPLEQLEQYCDMSDEAVQQAIAFMRTSGRGVSRKCVGDNT